MPYIEHIQPTEPMEDTTALTVRERSYALDRADTGEVIGGLHAVQDLMRAAMKEGEDYGKVPGCGDKPTLLQPGAQKLGMLFRLCPDYVIEQTDLQNGHREYSVKCKLTNTRGDFVGAGVGSCSTMETKYRFRNENTHRKVPGEYWKAKDASLLGGNTFTPRKMNGEWLIFQQVEHPNPADYFNTALKMAKKRAYVDAILTRTGASQVFTQDLEDLPAAEEAHVAPPPPPPPAPPKPPVSAPVEILPEDEQAPGAEVPPSPEMLSAGLKAEQMTSDELLDVRIHFGKNKDKTLREMGERTIKWYARDWELKPYQGKIQSDSAFLKAVCTRLCELNQW